MRHRGKQSDDDYYFLQQPEVHARMQAGAQDLEYLLDRGYALPSALQLVGNRYQLHKRQQLGLRRMAASPEAVRLRQAKQCAQSQRIAIDGYNLLIFLEAALSGGFLLRGADGCLRDMSGIHGSYHSVEETEAALWLAARTLSKIPRLEEVLWLFDAPVSNSGRLCTRLRGMCEEEGFPLPFPWEVQLVNNPDRELLALAEKGYAVVSTDAWILDELKGQWCDVHALALAEGVPDAQILDFLKK